ncbi:PadR family transcriptional regulator [Pseudonocardia acidicola]|uniref:PadR family transcriptional regulator n=1 Tax=Pseudonocardia acidicola TaxID=2724939 RepID=A0ABX1SHD2_9PSEU|nr:PadR family transcriptional regulator [Pseudonocardia acidicola]NMI00976.1 PadR family transcriptional regulator [Pseudonocardia acidicola]
MTWALPEWTVLAVLREQPRHGFAIAGLTAPEGELGRVWQIPRPVIYRALGRLEDANMVVPTTVESGPGPQRTVYAVTDSGAAAVDAWLQEPIEHVREIRSHLLMKLALLERRGIDPTELLRRQREVLEPIVRAIAAERDRHQGFDAVLLAWRHSTAGAALRFVDEIEASGSE